MPDHSNHDFSSDFFMPHGHCYLWNPGLLWLEVCSNMLIGLAYVAITATLSFLVFRVRDIPFKTMYLAFGLFIVACGFTHFLDVWTVWTPDYWVDGGVRALTAAASVGTAIALPPLVPKVVALARGAKVAQDRGIELETAVADLGSLYEKTRELERAKTQLFANVSHELRTPLTLILGPVEKVLQGTNLTEEQQRDLGVVLRNAQMLLKHVNDLLEVARLETGKVSAEYMKTDMARLVETVTSHFDAIAQERQIVYEISVPRSLTAEIDVNKMERVLINLLANAFKYTPEGGRIVCQLEERSNREAGAKIELRLADSGPGIPPNLRQAVFERFRQLDGGSTRTFGGTGLGLSISKEFVELHGGSISLSESSDGGALFTVELPKLAPPGVSVKGQAPVDERHSQQIALLALNELKAKVRSIAPEPDDERPLLLVVEDNAEMNRFICESLADRYRTTVARDGREGLEKALKFEPDLLLTDVMMPHMSGDQLVKELRARPQFDAMPIVLLSAKADEALRVELLRNGAQDYVMKPFAAEELKARIDNLVTMKRARDVLQDELDGQLTDLEGLAREVSSKKRDLETALDSLRVARDHAEKASSVKSNFLRLVSHELRTPLTVIRLHLDRLKRDVSLTTTQQDIAARMSMSTMRLSDLVDAVLEHTRIESGRLSTELQEFDVFEVARDVVDEYRSHADDKQLALSLNVPERLPALLSDRRLVRLILGNLLGNAIKFTASGGVRVALAAGNDEVHLSVSDTGPGIPAEFQRAIFEPFTQLEAMKHKSTPGVGLGLSLVDEMTSALGGSIELSSVVSEGSTFTVRLPLRPRLQEAS